MDIGRQGKPSALCPLSSKTNMIAVAIAMLLIGIAIGYAYWGNLPAPKTQEFEIENTKLAQQLNYISEYYKLVGQGNPLFEIENATVVNEIIKVDAVEKTTSTKAVFYFTKDYTLIPQAPISLSEFIDSVKEQIKAQEEEEKLANAEIPKTEKPSVELFVMSHCPYGTQAEKGIIPAIEALNKKVDFKVRFVYYAMHGEVEMKEQLNQYCIQKEQEEKYMDYLKCFLDKGKGAECISSTGIDTEKLEICTKSADTEFGITKSFNDKASWLSGSYPLFNIDAGLNTKYSVKGSPALVVNGVQVKSARDSASYLSAICNAFSEKPAECSTQLSSTPFSSGFGYTAGTSTTAECN